MRRRLWKSKQEPHVSSCRSLGPPASGSPAGPALREGLGLGEGARGSLPQARGERHAVSLAEGPRACWPGPPAPQQGPLGQLSGHLPPLQC